MGSKGNENHREGTGLSGREKLSHFACLLFSLLVRTDVSAQGLVIYFLKGGPEAGHGGAAPQCGVGAGLHTLTGSNSLVRRQD